MTKRVRKPRANHETVFLWEEKTNWLRQAAEQFPACAARPKRHALRFHGAEQAIDLTCLQSQQSRAVSTSRHPDCASCDFDTRLCDDDTRPAVRPAKTLLRDRSRYEVRPCQRPAPLHTAPPKAV